MDSKRITPRRVHTAPPSRRRSRWWPLLAAAPLTACLTAACTSAAGTGSKAASAATPASAATAPLSCAPPGVKQLPCYRPQAYQVAYGVAPLLRRGITGSGETVVLPELAETPPSTDIRQDLAAFDRKFGLPPARLRVVNTIARSKTPYLAGDEEVEDTEMVHAIAPGAILDVVLVPQDAALQQRELHRGRCRGNP